MPRVCQSRKNLMAWTDPERIYTIKATLGFNGNSKEYAWATNIRCTLLSQLSLGIFHELRFEWVFFSNVQVRNLKDSFFLFIYIFQQSQACACSITESKLKRKISHSFIYMGFIGLVTWLGVRGLWKKGSERLNECLRVTLSKNLESVACTFGLGFTPFVFYINSYCTFCAFLVNLKIFCLSFSSLAFGGFYFLFIVA